MPLVMSADFARRVRRKLRCIGRYDLRGIGKSQEVFTLVEE